MRKRLRHLPGGDLGAGRLLHGLLRQPGVGAGRARSPPVRVPDAFLTEAVHIFDAFDMVSLKTRGKSWDAMNALGRCSESHLDPLVASGKVFLGTGLVWVDVRTANLVYRVGQVRGPKTTTQTSGETLSEVLPVGSLHGTSAVCGPASRESFDMFWLSLVDGIDDAVR